MEQLFVVDENDHPIKSAGRDDAIANSYWRRASGGMILDIERKLVLCQKRSASKDERPGVWVATFGGKVRANETIEAAARRELNEELSLRVDQSNLVFFTKHRSVARQQFEYVFYAFLDSQKVDPVGQHDEVEKLAWISAREIQAQEGNPDWYFYGYERLILEKVVFGRPFTKNATRLHG